jgi:hypothetical protein
MISRRQFVGSLVSGGMAATTAGLVGWNRFRSDGPAADPLLNVRDFGARGDGRTNDTAAFQRAAAALKAAGGGTLLIPQGTYVVGAQTRAGRFGRRFAYQAHPILKLENCPRPVLIEGQNAVLRAAAGLRLGTFHPVTGAAREVRLPFQEFDYRADAYWGMIDLTGNADVTVRGLELDGNDAGLVLGGLWGDQGRQCAAIGIRAYGNRRLHIEDVHTHHHGLDGVIIGNTGLNERDSPRPHSLLRVVSEYNARQGLSWVGGIGLTATDCRFSHTGKARFTTSPGAGVDIEAEESVCRNGRFIRCEMVNNAGPGMVADVGDGGHSTFESCLFWGTTFWSAWPRRPALRFADCRFHGSVPNPFGNRDPRLATQFVRCHFEDRPYQAHGVYRSTALLEADGDNLLIDGCRFVANATKGVYIDGSGTREIVRDTTITHRHAGVPDGDFQSLLRGSELQNVRFVDEQPARPRTGWYISVDSLRVGPGVEVTGPHTGWGRPSGPRGRIGG